MSPIATEDCDRCQRGACSLALLHSAAARRALPTPLAVPDTMIIFISAGGASALELFLFMGAAYCGDAVLAVAGSAPAL